ncbi:MAG: GIY-YIG nuclease family protein [Xenococcus sp. (in: cyanobacteria)]
MISHTFIKNIDKLLDKHYLSNTINVMSDFGFIYFIYDFSNKQTKIGKTSKHPAYRVKELQTGNSNQLELLYFYETDRMSQEETMLHNQYNQYTSSVQEKGNKKGIRYKCYNSNGKCIGRIKGQPNSRYCEINVGQYDKHHSKKIDPLDITKGVGINAIKSFF